MALRLVFAGNKRRGVACLEAIVRAGHDVVAVLAHPDRGSRGRESVAGAAERLGLRLIQPERVDDPALIAQLAALAPEAGLLAGYSPIVGPAFLALFPRGCYNLHGGALPKYRGSSPMNWALMNGEGSFTINIIEVDLGVDTGRVVAEREFPIALDDTIADLQDRADAAFPAMVADVLRQVEMGTLRARPQNTDGAAYYPLRFPDDGFILWDQLTARQVHDRVRALTEPYPCAFTYVDGRRIRLLRSKLTARIRHGEPGRVYLKNANGVLVCASDRCLWITRAEFDDGADAVAALPRYAQLATVRSVALEWYRRMEPR